MKVYLLLSGEYSDKHVEHVVTSEAVANRLCELFAWYIEERELDDINTDEMPGVPVSILVTPRKRMEPAIRVCKPDGPPSPGISEWYEGGWERLRSNIDYPEHPWARRTAWFPNRAWADAEAARKLKEMEAKLVEEYPDVMGLTPPKGKNYRDV